MSTQRPAPPRPLPRAKPTPSGPGGSLGHSTPIREAPGIPGTRKLSHSAATTVTTASSPVSPHPKTHPRPLPSQSSPSVPQRPAPPKPARPMPHPKQQHQTTPSESNEPQNTPERPEKPAHLLQKSCPSSLPPPKPAKPKMQQSTPAPETSGESATEPQNPIESHEKVAHPNQKGSVAPRVPTAPKPVIKKRHSAAGKPPPPKPPVMKTAAAAVREAEEQPRQQPQTHEDGTPLTKRDQIAREILTTERTFVDLIQIALKEYYLPLFKSSPPIIPVDKLNIIFGNMKDILQINTVLLNDLECKMKEWSPTQKIGDAFAKMAPFLKIYTLYVSNFDNATATLDACEKTSAFSAFLESCHDNPACRGQPLPSLLILPVQRIPRYRLLLEDLVKHTEETHPDYNDLKKSLDTIKSVANQINEDVKRQENRQKIMEIQSKFSSLAGSLNLVEAHRLYIREGVLWKICRRASKKRIFYLFNDLMLYASALPTGGLMVHRVIPLGELRVSDVPDTEAVTNAFMIGSSKKSFVVSAETPNEKFDWLVDISNAEKELKSKNLSLKKEMSTKEAEAPVWQPDKSAKKCTICGTDFTAFTRRHHCRSCGRLVCANCSTHRLILPNIDKSQQRVCDKCYDEFKRYQASTMSASSGSSSPAPTSGAVEAENDDEQ